MAVNGVSQQLSDMTNRFSQIRTGIVTAVDPFFATVAVGSTAIRASFVSQSEPVTGDTVNVARQGASWLVLGTSSVSGGNSVFNPSFEEISEDGSPTGWTTYTISGSVPDVSVVTDPIAPEGSSALEVGSVSGTSTSFVYSSPISVIEADQWELSAYVNGHYPSINADTTDVSLRALWFANSTDLYPTTSAADSTIASVTDITQDETMRVIRGTVTVPAGAVFLRVGLRTAAAAYAAAHWDFVTARRVGP